MGSGPSLNRLLAATCVWDDNQAVGKACGGKPSKTNATGALLRSLFSKAGRHCTGTPLLLERALADSKRDANLSASRSKSVCEVSRKLKLTVAVPMAIKAMTTSNSIKVKPMAGLAHGFAQVGACDEEVSRERFCNLALLPTADVGIHTLTTRLTVCAPRHDIHLGFEAGIEVLVRPAPWIGGQFV